MPGVGGLLADCSAGRVSSLFLLFARTVVLQMAVLRYESLVDGHALTQWCASIGFYRFALTLAGEFCSPFLDI